MKRLLLVLGLAALLGTPAAAQRTLFVAPDVPTDDPGGSVTVFLPWEVLAYSHPNYVAQPVVSFPENTIIDALHKLDAAGHWLISVETTMDLPPGTGRYFQPEDVIRYDGSTYDMYFDGSVNGVPRGANVDAVFLIGDDSGDLVISVDVPTTIGAATYEPADLVRYSGGVFSLFFDASGAGLGVALSDNVTGADESGWDPVLAVDIPSDLLPSTGPTTYVPGQIVDWDGTNFNLFEALIGWPLSSEVDALSCQANPGRVYERTVYPNPVTLGKSMPVVSNIVISWAPSCSSGAEDYGIYEGTLASLRSGPPPVYNHVPVTCTDTGGDLTEEITPATVSTYYLVVPHNSAEEGTYGKDFVWNRVPPEIERPQSAIACFGATQVITLCPP